MRQGSIRKNYIMNLLLRLTRIIIPLVTFPYISRILQPEGLGRVSFAESFISYLTMIAQLGVPTYGIRACARVRDDKEKLSRTVHELVTINVIMSIAVYLALLICVAAVPRIRDDWKLFAIFSINIIMTAVGMDWLYEGLEQYSYITIRSLILRLLSVALVFLLVRNPDHAAFYAGTIVVSTAGPRLINLVHARKYIFFYPVGYYRLIPHIKAALIFFLIAGVTAIYTNLDKVMLGFMAGDIQVGYYSVAVKVKIVVYTCISALVAVLLPRSSYYVEMGEMEEHRKLSNSALNYILIFATSLSLFFFIYANESVLFLSGEAYLLSVAPMRFLMISVCLAGITNVFTTQILIPQGKEKYALRANVTGAIIDVILNLFVIPKYGATGAALSTFLAELGVFLTVSYYGRVYVDIQSISFWKILLSLIFAALSSFLLRQANMGLFLKLACGGTVFFTVYIFSLLTLREKLTMEIVHMMIRKIRKH